MSDSQDKSVNDLKMEIETEKSMIDFYRKKSIQNPYSSDQEALVKRIKLHKKELQSLKEELASRIKHRRYPNDR